MKPLHAFRTVLLLCGLAASMPGWANQPYCPSILLEGVPQTSERLRLICRDGYALGHSPSFKMSRWVVERLRADALYGDEPRDNSFQEDSALPSAERATLSDYRGSGCDRGHLAPAGDFTRDARLMTESFFLSNMVPQEPSHNRGVWMVLEKMTRQIAKKRGEVVVVSGPVIDSSSATPERSKQVAKVAVDVLKILGKDDIASVLSPRPNNKSSSLACHQRQTIGSGIPVPKALYKIVYDPRRGEGLAFVIPNVPEEELFSMAGVSDKRDRESVVKHFAIPISAAENKIGVNVLPSVPQDKKERISPSFFGVR